jgi:DNA-binding LacI/PurR family transcriptional regulator
MSEKGRKMKTTTIKDIAKKLGISFSTVSRALSNDPVVNAKTAQKIKEMAAEMDYTPNLAARGLVRGKSEAIAFVSTRFAAPFISNVLDSFEQRAFYTNRYVHGISPYSTRNEEELKELLLKRILRGKMADAVVMLTIKPREETLAGYNAAKVPVILIENAMKGAHSITINNQSGAEKAVNHILDSGRRNIGLIIGETMQPPSRDVNSAAVERKLGYVAAHEKRGLHIKENNVEVIHAYIYEEGKKALDNFLKKQVKPDAIFCAAGDIVAMGVLERAVELGIKIPGDIAVIGYDDVLAARHLNPPLTTVRQPLEEIGIMAFDMAIEAIDGKLKKDKNVVIDPELIIRKSA